jgi:hypothetical protein
MYYLREPGWVTEPEPDRGKKLSKTTFSFTRKIKGSPVPSRVLFREELKED